MKKTISFSLLLVLFGFTLLACSKSEEYEPPSEEEESITQMATDSLSGQDAKTRDLDN